MVDSSNRNKISSLELERIISNVLPLLYAQSSNPTGTSARKFLLAVVIILLDLSVTSDIQIDSSTYITSLGKLLRWSALFHASYRRSLVLLPLTVSHINHFSSYLRLSVVHFISFLPPLHISVHIIALHTRCLCSIIVQLITLESMSLLPTSCSVLIALRYYSV